MGQYLGLKPLKFLVSQLCLHQYQNGDSFPSWIQIRYCPSMSCSDGKPPKINKLNINSLPKAKQKVNPREVEDIAGSDSAERSQLQGFAFTRTMRTRSFFWSGFFLCWNRWSGRSIEIRRIWNLQALWIASWSRRGIWGRQKLLCERPLKLSRP